MLSFSSLPQESKSNLHKGRGRGRIRVSAGGKSIFSKSLSSAHSVLNRRLMEFMHGGNGNVDSLFISFALSSAWSQKGKRTHTHGRRRTLIAALS